MRISSKKLTGLFGIFAFLFLATTCNPGPGPDPGLGNNQQIFESWILDEIIRKGCDDANNNLRRACTDCSLLVMHTDNTYQLMADSETLIGQGNFRVVNDDEIVFDPSIFTNGNVTDVRYSLFKGAMKFDYVDLDLDCAVTEAYLVNRTVVGD